MRKLFAGAAAAALVTAGLAGVTAAQTVGPIGVPVVINNDAWVFNPPVGGGVGFLVSVEGVPSSFLIDRNGVLEVDFGPGGLEGAIVYTPGFGPEAFAPRQ